MKAWVTDQPGGPESLQLRDLPDPAPGPGEAVVEIGACGVNFADFLIIQDKYQNKPPRPFTPGIEMAGTISALGAGMDGFSLGDRVIGYIRTGGYAERALARRDQLTRIPDTMALDTAAAMTTTYGTAYYALRERGALKPGETLFVLGAGGGAGLAAVELGRAFGARVIAAASAQEKLDLALAHGAQSAFLYPRGPFDAVGRKALSAAIKSACGSDGWDVAFDVVGGDYTEATMRASAWDGRLLVIGFAAGIPAPPLNLALLKSCSLIGVAWGAWVARDWRPHHVMMQDLIALERKGAIRPHISARFPFDEAPAAIAHLAARKALGKVVILGPGGLSTAP